MKNNSILQNSFSKWTKKLSKAQEFHKLQVQKSRRPLEESEAVQRSADFTMVAKMNSSRNGEHSNETLVRAGRAQNLSQEIDDIVNNQLRAANSRKTPS